MDSLSFYGFVLIALGFGAWVRWIGMLIAGNQYINLKILDSISDEDTAKELGIDSEKEGSYSPTRLDQFQWAAGLLLILLGLALMPW